VASIYHARSGHPGGSLSCADLLTALFAAGVGRVGAGGTKQRLVLSKGHASPALYAAAAEYGLISHADLLSFRKLHGKLQGHPHVGTTAWVETSTGSLGQGFSVAIGMALGCRHQGQADRIYVVLGDGELQEGEVWEGAMCAAHHGLGNLCAIIDYNKMQSDDRNENIMDLEPLRAKWEAFNWHVVEIDGHDFEQIGAAFAEAAATHSQPTVIIAHTIKGQGVSFMAGVPAWHGSVTLSCEELKLALRDLGTPEDEVLAYVDGSIWRRT
jgi:transketolase